MKASEILGIILAALTVAGGVASAIFAHNSKPPWSQRYGYFPGDDVARYANTSATATTPHGVHYRDEVGIDPARIDLVVDALESCAGKVDRSKFVVLIPADQGLSCDGTQQILPVSTPENAGCHPTTTGCHEPDGRCHYRATVAEPNVIVATRSLYLLPDALERFLYSVDNPYTAPGVPRCTGPFTGPLD